MNSEGWIGFRSCTETIADGRWSQQNVYRVLDLPYQSQLVPLAAIFANIGESRSENSANLEKIARWYWCGIFGELYGSASESRFAKDIIEVPAWLDGGPGARGGNVRLGVGGHSGGGRFGYGVARQRLLLGSVEVRDRAFHKFVEHGNGERRVPVLRAEDHSLRDQAAPKRCGGAHADP